jgi:hypothetical protein
LRSGEIENLLDRHRDMRKNQCDQTLAAR